MNAFLATAASRVARGLLGRTLIIAAAMVACIAFPVSAQDGTGPVPDNAKERSYGSGWNCVLGYRVNGAECVAIDIPENAYATGRSYGLGWACLRGYRESEGISCELLPVPENAFLRPTGYDWQCDRGYRKHSDACVPIVLPDNAYLADGPSGSGWTCERGYSESAGGCAPIAVPENGYLTNKGLRTRMGLREEFRQDRWPLRSRDASGEFISGSGPIRTGLAVRSGIQAHG